MNTYKNSALFLIKFFGTYFLLFLLYATYLNCSQKKEGDFSCSPLTKKVASQTVTVLKSFGYPAEALQHSQELSVKLVVDGTYVARVIEGCNSMSIIILFIAFIAAFSGPIKATFLYALLGSLLLYGVNVLRISLLTLLLYKYPSEQMIFHNLVFPAIIYGTTFLLWIVWVHKFSYYKK